VEGGGWRGREWRVEGGGWRVEGRGWRGRRGREREEREEREGGEGKERSGQGMFVTGVIVQLNEYVM
jgi:hypothetical protein